MQGYRPVVPCRGIPKEFFNLLVTVIVMYWSQEGQEQTSSQDKDDWKDYYRGDSSSNGGGRCDTDDWKDYYRGDISSDGEEGAIQYKQL